ncbi:uncharacterized protein BXZ73DRAFT_106639 [Epithele typhae]|uniref:uncharacterized protein n=1 Tax=Epithele typhae TaxID=378194 RepID=UPI00200855A5|nr:uncharacterized protein BXZ73DRAFT_106639 [Epithele typhae]KAH9914396.1 hypothetical protein BXZ73DRAFT_106639 [Epithele typhae]
MAVPATAGDASTSATAGRCGTNGSSTTDFHYSTSNPSPHTLQRTAPLSEIIRGLPTVTIAVLSRTGTSFYCDSRLFNGNSHHRRRPSLSELDGTVDLEISMHKRTNAVILAVLCALAYGTSDALRNLIIGLLTASFTVGIAWIAELVTLPLRAPLFGLQSASVRFFMLWPVPDVELE